MRLRSNSLRGRAAPQGAETGQVSRGETLRSIGRSLRHRNYSLFFSGQAVSLIGTWMQMVALSWLVYEMTGSEWLLGVVGFAARIPIFFLSPLAGTFIDRIEGRRLILGTQTAAMVLACLMAGLALSGAITVWEIIVLSVLLGVVNAIDIPARQTFVVRMVGKADLSNAIALNSSLVNIARTVGPAIGGWIVAALGEGWCFAINGASFLAVIVALLMMRIEDIAAPRAPVKTLGHMAEGMRYMRRTPRIRSVLLLLGVVSVTGVPFMVLLPVFAGRVGAGGAEVLGTMMAAAGIGSLLAAAPLAVVRDVARVDIWPIWAALGFGVTLIVFALPAPYWLSLAILVPVGFFMMLQSAASNTVLQHLVADDMRGRVMAVYAMMFMGMIPFGSLLAGAVAERIGAAWTVAGGGAFCLVAGAIALLAYRRGQPPGTGAALGAT